MNIILLLGYLDLTYSTFLFFKYHYCKMLLVVLPIDEAKVPVAVLFDFKVRRTRLCRCCHQDLETITSLSSWQPSNLAFMYDVPPYFRRN